MEAVILVGVSASGKSTRARELCKEGYLVLDRDDLRFSLTKAEDWSEYQFDNAVESIINNAHKDMAYTAAQCGRNLVIAETNLKLKVRTDWKLLLESLGYSVRIEPLYISLQEAIDRDSKRKYSVGREVIESQWNNWLNFLQQYEEEGLYESK